jgi:hypothetical protein
MLNQIVLKRIGLSIAGIIALAFLPGCGSVDNGPHPYQFATAVLQEAPPTCAVAKDVDEHLQKAMNEDFFGKRAFQHGNELTVQYQIMFVNEGNRAMRAFVGFGTGKGKVTVQATFKDGKGKQLATIMIDGEVNGGVYGGSIYSAAENCADQISDYATDNYLRDPRKH